jgi:tetratricopeptide (TPR) repeat protein
MKQILIAGALGFGLAACAQSSSARPASAAAGGPERGIALYNEGKYAEAEAALRGAGGPDASAYLAASIARQKRYAEAEAPAKAALEAVPTHPVGLAALGESLVGQKKLEEAIERLSAALRAKDDLAYAYYWRGQAYYQSKQTARMIEDFQRFLKLAPEAPEAEQIKVLLAGLR